MPDNPSEVKLSNVTPKLQTPDDILDIFNDIDKDEKEDKENKPKKEAKQEKEDSDDDKEDKDKTEDEIELVDEEDEESLDLTKDDDDDEIEIDAPPRKQQLLKDFPELFKKHPFLEKMLYRDKQYTELFGSLDDAKELAEKAEVFDHFDKQLLSGNTEELLKNVKETDPKAFDKIVDNYLITLAKVDKEAYFDVISNISKRLIKNMAEEGKKTDNDELQKAALLINQFLFHSSEYVPPKNRVTEDKSSEQSEAEKDRLNHLNERFTDSQHELQGKVDNILKSTISQYIDPKGLMTNYVKKNAINDALKNLHISVGNDVAFRKNLDRLWRNAFENRFSRESLDKIQSLFLGKAKLSLPNAIKKAKAEALKDLQPRAKRESDDDSEKDQEEKTPRRGNVTTGRPSQPKGKNEMKKGESVADFFARD